MAAHGVVKPMPDVAIFADTMAEPQHVYDWLDWLEAQLPFPVIRVSKGNLREAVVTGGAGARFAPPPFYTTSINGGGMLRRQCTREYKVEPIEKKLRELAGYKPRQRISAGTVEQWIGISWDEKERMKMARNKWCVNRWPLIEMHMTRMQCLEWMRDNGYNELPKKSACTFCPYHDNSMWRDMKENDPESWKDACSVDEAIRGGFEKTSQSLYVHQSMVPLREADLSDKNSMQYSFLDECDGMCGV